MFCGRPERGCLSGSGTQQGLTFVRCYMNLCSMGYTPSQQGANWLILRMCKPPHLTPLQWMGCRKRLNKNDSREKGVCGLRLYKTPTEPEIYYKWFATEKSNTYKNWYRKLHSLKFNWKKSVLTSKFPHSHQVNWSSMKT